MKSWSQQRDLGTSPPCPARIIFSAQQQKKKSSEGESRDCGEQQAALPCGEGVSDCPQPPPCPAAHKGLFVAVQPRWHLSPRALLCPQFPSGPPACEGFWQPLAPRASSWLAPARLSGAGSPHLLCAHTHTLVFFCRGCSSGSKKRLSVVWGWGF